MFHMTKNSRQDVYKIGKMLPILPASTLLSSQSYQSLIERVQALSEMPDEHFQVSYHILIRRVSEYVQVLPKSLDSKLCSLLNKSLLRAAGVLQAYVDYNNQATPLQRFALFSALLLRDVSCVFTRYTVVLTDDEGKHTHYWDPMQGPMTQQREAEFFKLIPMQVDQSRLHEMLSVILAPELMSPTTYEWLTGDRAIFVEWLDLMTSSGLKGGDFTYFYERFLEKELEEGYDFGELFDIEYDQKDAPDSEVAEKFLEWLNKALKKGDLDKLDLNKSGVNRDYYAIEGGIFLGTDTLRQFETLYKFPNGTVHYSIGNLLGAPSKGGNDFCHAKFYKGTKSGFGSLVKRSRTEVNGVYLSDRLVKTSNMKKSSIQVTKMHQKESLPSLGESSRQTISPDHKR